ncbi:magnesium/cobalt transporter CorA [Gloeobacter violaceus]|uniref:Magnesium transport protein CorA n=1 Tax=Gloeobacter violaceus (strain ATCC 29082 / PCC 7421) TaxID=251221 RepID=Q7NLU6_GLOVI|nr:magnesium/cobalt transporter CorA [Gloeobacter violaceus]BAC88964.1 gll1023 [Gloeobacter violaceus PCC 7421]
MRDRKPEAGEAMGSDEDESYVDYHYDDPGTMPGTLSIDKNAPPPEIHLIDYDAEQSTGRRVENPEELTPYLDNHSVSWADVRGFGSEDILRRLGKVFGLHPLVLEDIVNVPQRPKVEEYKDHLLIIARMVCPTSETAEEFFSEQVSLILGKNYLLTVQEEAKFDVFGPVRERIRTAKGIICNQRADYLAYTLLDAIIDGFYPVLEDFGERLEELEAEVVENPTRATLERIYLLRRELLMLRRAIWPQRDVINALIRDANPLIGEEVRLYLRDCYDHAIQIIDMVETYRELASSLTDIYMSSVSNRMNEVMKTLTVISAIFIPLTFIAGVYGMNFDPEKSPWNMPELEWYWGYPFSLVLMFIVAVGLVVYFWRRGWFESFSSQSKK